MLTPSQQYLTISRRALDVEDYIDIIRRHVSWIMGPLFAGLVISCVVAFLLPNTYVSTATMRITPPQISQSLVPATVDQQMNDRISQMQQEILSTTSLSQLIQQPTLNLYPRERASGTLQDVVERMRAQDVRIQLISLSGANGRATSAFTISYAYPDRFKAQLVVQALIAKFTESMINVQGIQGKETLNFLKDENTSAKTELNRLDSEITQFRIQNAGHLPEELQVNMQALTGLQGQLSGVNDALNRIAEDRMRLETNLNTLQMQRDNYAEKATTTLEGSTARMQNERLSQLNREITQLDENLLQLQAVYTEKMPVMKNARAQLAIKKQERDQLQAKEDAEAAKPKAVAKTITNPVALERLSEVQGTIDMVNTEMRNKDTEKLERLKQLDQINKATATYESRIAQVPANQQKYVALIRERDLAAQNYQELQRKQTAATTYDHVETRQAGEKLDILDAASLPEAPTAPNRWLITGIGVGLGLGIGIFLTGVKEVKDTSLKNLKDVRAYTNLPILSSIPLLENDLLVRRKRRLAYVGWSAAVILGMVAMCSSMYYHYFLIAT